MNNFLNQIKDKRPQLINSIIALGSPIVDILAEIDESDIMKYNLKKDEATLANDVNRQFYNDITGKSQVLETPGGSAQNILRATSWSLMLDNTNLTEPKKLSMLGSIGNDTYGNTDNFVRSHWDKIISHDALLVEGYFLAENFNLAYNICKEFFDKRKYIILTLSDPSIIKQYRDQVITIANMADMIVGNINEAKNLIQEEKDIKINGINNLFNKIYALLSNKTRIIIITVGSSGVFCSQYDSISGIKSNFQTFANYINSNEIIDFNGAGDAFLGGFLSQQMLNKTFENCCRLGNYVASVVIKNFGCNFPNINNILVRN